MLRSYLALLLLLSACSSGTGGPSTTANGAPTTTGFMPVTTTSTAAVPALEACDDVPYRPLVIPARASGSDTQAADLGDDPYTTIPGTTIKLWVDANADPVMALIRGALPPEPWAGPTAAVEVLRGDAALGPLSGDRWAVAWFESEDRCDLYTLVLWPPTSAADARDVAESLIPDR